MNARKPDDPVIYVPAGAKFNIDPTNQEPPTVEYNRRMHVLDLEEVKKVVGGEYGKKASRDNPK